MTTNADLAPAPGELGFSATEAIVYGWRKYTEHVGQMVLATSVLLGVTVGVALLSHAAADRWLIDSGEFSVAALGPSIVTGLAAYIIGAAIIRGALDIAQGYGFDLLESFRLLPIVDVLTAAFVAAIPTALAMALNQFLGSGVVLFSLFVFYRVVDKRSNVIRATRDSINLVRDQRSLVTSLVLLSTLCLVAGSLALCIGVLVALPVLAIAWAYAYQVLRSQPVAP